MIGQTELKYMIHDEIQFGDFPRFSIIVGPEGSGKKTLTFEIAYDMDIPRVVIEPKVEAVREMITNAYKVASPVLYVIVDADKMSSSAKNAMLKVCEETPNNAYIIMLVNDISTVLDTIASRARMYFMQPYTRADILEYTQKIKKVNDYIDIITDLCEVPKDVDMLCEQGVIELYEFVEKVIDNIATVSGANAFKIADSISFKDGDKGYNINLFLRAFRSICAREMKRAVAENDMESQMYYSVGIRCVSGALNQLKITGINKGALFDIFILDIRKEWA